MSVHTAAPGARSSRVAIVGGALVALFAFRLLYGLSSEFFFEDETQIFLMGLRWYATGEWPYFGPDVVWTESEIPGALQPLLVGAPLHIAPIPEAPFVFLNLLSFSALAAFAWYVTLRLPGLPRWLVWGWLMTLPWTLDYSTHVINPSYVLAPALVFFIGFFEAMPMFRLGTIREPTAFVMMGAAIGWVMQVHLSWPLLLPYIALAWLAGWRHGVRAVAANTGAFAVGLLLFGSFLIPTFLVYGMGGGSGGTLRNLRPHWVSPYVALSTLARLFSFASLEIWRFIATDDGKRIMFMVRNPWMTPLAAVCWAAGIWQPIWMLGQWFRSASPLSDWRAIKWLVAATVALVYASYWFVLEPPQAHAFYVVAPVGFMFAAYCWTFVDSPKWRRIAAILLTTNVVFHVGQAWIQAPEKSLFRNREVAAAAIRLKQPEMFGHRRPFAIAAGPPALQDPSRPYDVRQDIQLSNTNLDRGTGGVVLWTFTLRNNNPRVAYRDVFYQTHYRDESGQVVEERHDRIKDIFQPGDVATLEVNDGLFTAPFASATIDILGGDALLPLVEAAGSQ
ncbi:MAG TPA: hypothetical protein VM818_01955 [Vicinamibacterales bacterium]|nr:hypothetical protein [Vicinamibacterales bacterium]